MKTLFAVVLSLLLFFCPFAVQAEDIELMPQAEMPKAAPSPDRMTVEAIRNYKVRKCIKALLAGKAKSLYQI